MANDTAQRRRLHIAKPRAVLNEAEAIAIFQLRPRSDLPRVVRDSLSVAQAFTVSEKTVRDIWSARTWHRETLHLDPSRPARADTLPGRPLGRKDSAPRRRPVRKSKLPAATDADDPFHDDWPNWERADHFSEQLMPKPVREAQAPAAKRPRRRPSAPPNTEESPTHFERAQSSSPDKVMNRAKGRACGDDDEARPPPSSSTLLLASWTPPPEQPSITQSSATPTRPQAHPSWQSSASPYHLRLSTLDSFPPASAGPKNTRLAGLPPPHSNGTGSQATATAAAIAIAIAAHRLRGVAATPRLAPPPPPATSCLLLRPAAPSEAGAPQWSHHPSLPLWHVAPPSPRRNCLNGTGQCEALLPPPPVPPYTFLPAGGGGRGF